MPNGNVQALLKQRHELVFAHALAPARHRGAIERQLVLEEFLTTEQLIICILQPALAQPLVGEIVHVLEDRDPSHEPRRQWRMARTIGVHRTEAPLEKAPVDRGRQLCRRVVHVDDLVEPGAEQILRTAVASLFRSHPNHPLVPNGTMESLLAAGINLQEITLKPGRSGKYEYLPNPNSLVYSGR